MRIIHWITIILVIATIGSAAFYWFSWRPSQIKISCDKSSIDQAIAVYMTTSKTAGHFQPLFAANGKFLFDHDDARNFYNECLKEHGL